jgi:signal transduction histidine kinase
MKNSKAARKGRRSERLWLPSLLLLLGQFLTITPALLIVLADEQQRKASDGYVILLDGLDRLSLAVAELPNTGAGAGASWRQQYSDYRGQLDHTLASSAPAPQVREALSQVDAIVERMSKTESDLVALTQTGRLVKPQQAEALTASFQKDGRTARSELSDTARSLRIRLSTTGQNINQLNTYLKALVGGACLLAFGVVFLVRKFRIDAAIQRELQEELETINQEVITALDAARSESETKNQFLAYVGNLMRTPLNAIAVGTQELIETDLTSRQLECAQNTLELAETLKRVAGQVDDYSRMQTGGIVLESMEFDPGKIVADVFQLFVLPAESKGLKLKIDVGKALPALLKGDPERLRQILLNLMSNAVRFTEKGEISLRAEEVSGTEGRASLRFEVKDTGIGLSQQDREKVFQPFSQIAPVIAGVNPGTGLGLAISKKLVELMGGKIDVSSNPSRGCTFHFTAVFENVRVTSDRVPEPSAAVAPPSPMVSPTPQNGKKPGRERRSEPRQGVNYPTLLRSEQAGIAIIRILDVSHSGLRVSVPFRLTVLSEVEIRIEGASVVGTVRNCTCISPNEFHVGIELRPASSEDEHFLHHLRLLRTERV